MKVRNHIKNEEERRNSSIFSFDQNKNFPSDFGKDENGCFIATAVSTEHNQLDFLRKYRDQKLRKSKSGSFLVDTYYRLSPPIAAVIINDPKLKEFAKENFVSIALKIANKGLKVEEFTYEDGRKMGEVIGTVIAVKGIEFAEEYIQNVLPKAFDSTICGCGFFKGVYQGIKDSLKKNFLTSCIKV